MKLRVSIPETIEPVSVFGVNDSNIKFIEQHIKVKIYPKDGDAVIVGDESSVEMARNVFENMLRIARKSEVVSEDDVYILLRRAYEEGTAYTVDEILARGVKVSRRGRIIKPKTVGQAALIKAIMDNDIVFVIGPAGTGKTFLATAVALNYLFSGKVSRIILTRPAVEAGESLGFLPGNIEEKVNPYLRPLYDSLFDMLGPDEYSMVMEKDIIEVAPLAFMRGRTLNDSFVILDEAQNTTPHQMKMFLTRLGFSSKMVITGDITQSDIKEKESGLKQAEKLFADVDGIGIVYLTEQDIVRHSLVRKIVSIYEKVGV